MRFYFMPFLGNSYKIRLFPALIGRETDIIDCEIGSARSEQIKADGRLPYGKVLVSELNDGRILGESGAIMWYWGVGTKYVPTDEPERAQILGRMFREQYSSEPVVAVRQSLLNYLSRAAEAIPERLAELRERGYSLLHVMEGHLNDRRWLAGEQESLTELCP